MVPNTSHTCVGLEYFCFRGDELWSRSDEALVALAGHELEQLGLASAAKIVEGVVVRATHAYPIYDKDYDRSIRSLRDYLEGFDNLQVIGRNGMHKYNNQDHSMLTAMAAVRNILGERLDVWAVNTETSYIEEIRKRDVRPTPTPVIET